MAENPYVNKVEYVGQTLMDLTGDTATPSDVLNGKTFHDRSGAPQQGNLITHNVYDGLDSTSISDALSANQGKVLNSKLTGIIYDVFTIDTTNVNANNLFFRERIGIMTINGWVKLKSAATQDVIIGTISQGHRPVDVCRIPVAFSDQAYNVPTGIGYLAIGSNGEMRVIAPPGNTNTVIYFSCSYLTQG